MPAIVIQDGEIVVDFYKAIAQHGDVVLVTVELISKFAVIDWHGTLNDIAFVSLRADESTMRTNEKKRGQTTNIAFSNFPGFRVFAAQINRYMLSVALVKQ